MGLLDLFRSPKPNGGYPDLPRICYAAAYRVLPNLAFSEGKGVLEQWDNDPPKACELIYALACSQSLLMMTMLNHATGKLTANPADSRKLRMHIGQLDASRRYYIVEYPPAPPFDPASLTPERLTAAGPPVLAPHFSAVIRNVTSGEIGCYVLGQSPGGGTTFRSVSAGGINSNCGPGPEPKLESWLQHLKGRA